VGVEAIVIGLPMRELQQKEVVVEVVVCLMMRLLPLLPLLLLFFATVATEGHLLLLVFVPLLHQLPT